MAWLGALMGVLLSFLLVGMSTPAQAATRLPDVSHAAPHSQVLAKGYFDKGYLKTTCHWVISDMRTVDSRLSDGIAVSSAFYLLSGSYGYMLHAGVPPTIVQKSLYKARIQTLSQFAESAGNEYYGNRTQALARYWVIRHQTRILFRQINSKIGTSFKVPKL